MNLHSFIGMQVLLFLNKKNKKSLPITTGRLFYVIKIMNYASTAYIFSLCSFILLSLMYSSKLR
jgi:hypothetical protein